MFVWEKWSCHLIVQGFWCACGVVLHINYMLFSAHCVVLQGTENETKPLNFASFSVHFFSIIVCHTSSSISSPSLPSSTAALILVHLFPLKLWFYLLLWLVFTHRVPWSHIPYAHIFVFPCFLSPFIGSIHSFDLKAAYSIYVDLSLTHSLIHSPIVCMSIFRCYSPFFRLFYPNSSSSLISYLTNEWIEIWFDVRIIYFSVHSNSTYYLISLCLFVLRLLLPLRPLLLLLPSSLLVVIRVL